MYELFYKLVFRANLIQKLFLQGCPKILFFLKVNNNFNFPMKFEFRYYYFISFCSKILIFYLIFFGINTVKNNKSFAESLRDIQERESKRPSPNCSYLYKNAEWGGNSRDIVYRERYYRKRNNPNYLYQISNSGPCSIKLIPLDKKINSGKCNWFENEEGSGFTQEEFSLENQQRQLIRRWRWKNCQSGKFYPVQKITIPRINRGQYLP